MKWIAAVLCLASLVVLGGLGLAHTVAVKKVDRGMFVSAQVLAVSCQTMKDAVGDDYLLDPGKTYKLTAGDMAAVGRCTGYIEGVADEFRVRESVGHYHPVPAGRGELPILIDTFLKRVADHSEERDFAASTVLHEADNDVLRLMRRLWFWADRSSTAVLIHEKMPSARRASSLRLGLRCAKDFLSAARFQLACANCVESTNKTAGTVPFCVLEPMFRKAAHSPKIPKTSDLPALANQMHQRQ